MTRRLHPNLLALAAGLCLAAPSCAGLDEVVTARSTPAGVVATNESSRTATYTILDPGLLPLITLVDCSRPENQCPRIEPGQTITIPWTDVLGYGPDVHAYELSWTLLGRPARGGKVELPYPPAAP